MYARIRLGLTFSLLAAVPTVGARPAQAGETKPAAGDFELSRRWLAAFRTSRAEDLAAATALPFAFASTDGTKRCEEPAKNDGELGRWATCAREAQLAMLSELEVPGEKGLRTNVASERKSLLALAGKLRVPPGGAWTRASFRGDGVTYRLRFLVVKRPDGNRGVAAFLVDSVFED